MDHLYMYFNILKGIGLEISSIKNANEKQFTWSSVVTAMLF